MQKLFGSFGLPRVGFSAESTAARLDKKDGHSTIFARFRNVWAAL